MVEGRREEEGSAKWRAVAAVTAVPRDSPRRMVREEECESVERTKWVKEMPSLMRPDSVGVYGGLRSVDDPKPR